MRLPFLIFVPAVLLFEICTENTDAQCRVSLPLKQLKVNSSFGPRIHPLTGSFTFHRGIDLAAHADTVYSILDGTVTRVGNDPALGNYIEITHSERLVSIYGHLSAIGVWTGEQVNAGTPVGITGSSGRVTGPHLHFAVKYDGRFLSPLAFLTGLTQ